MSRPRLCGSRPVILDDTDSTSNYLIAQQSHFQVAEDMESMHQMVIKTIQYALLRDSTNTSRPINQEVGSPKDIRTLFDVIAYDKAASVIRMVEGVISTDIFRKGLNIYLNNM